MGQATADNRDIRSISIKQEILIEASKETVFTALTSEMSAWWGAPYLIGSEPQDILVEAKLGGHVYEDWGNGNGAIWGTVTQWKTNEIFEFTGKIGMGGAVTGVVCFELESKDGGTLLKLEHDAVGQVTEKSQQGYAYGWNDLLKERLQAFVERGERHGLKK